MAGNALSIAKRIAKLTKSERQLVIALADSLGAQRVYTRKPGRKPGRKAKRAPTVARRAKDPNAPKRKYTKKSAFWKNKKNKK